MTKNLYAMVIAGGKGKRLRPLTLPRAKPSVPFGGELRIIDIVVSNLVNSGIKNVDVLIQAQNNSLNQHIQRTYKQIGDQYHHAVFSIPPRFGVDSKEFRGNADAIYQNLNRVYDNNPSDVAVFGADHIYKMDVSQMMDFHNLNNADLTIAAIPTPIEHARSFGVIEVDSDYRITNFVEKPKNPKPLPDNPTMCLVSMGNYIFDTEKMIKVLVEDHKKSFIHKPTDLNEADTEEFLKMIALDPSLFEKITVHDMSQNIVRKMLNDNQKVFAYNFDLNEPGGVPPTNERGYWRDVGSLEQYVETSLELLAPLPRFDLYPKDMRWPLIRTATHLPGGKIVFLESDVKDSIVSPGAIISGAKVYRSILSSGAHCEKNSSVNESILFDKVQVGEYAQLNRVIVDKSVVIDDSSQFNPVRIGFDPELDKKRGFYVVNHGNLSENITVIPKGAHILSDGSIKIYVPYGLEDDPDLGMKKMYKNFLREVYGKDYLMPEF